MPALNDLLRPYGIAFGDAVLEGQATMDGEQIFYASGANIVRFPAGGYLHAQSLADKAAAGGCPSRRSAGSTRSCTQHARDTQHSASRATFMQGCRLRRQPHVAMRLMSVTLRKAEACNLPKYM